MVWDFVVYVDKTSPGTKASLRTGIVVWKISLHGCKIGATTVMVSYMKFKC